MYKDFENAHFGICEDQGPLTLELGAGQEVIWNGDSSLNSNLLDINETGFYFGMMNTMGSACKTTSPSIYAELIQEEESPVLLQPVIELCKGESLILYGNESVIEWSNGEGSETISVNSPGVYFYSAAGICDTVISNSVVVDVLEAVTIEDTTVIIPVGVTPEVILADEHDYEWSFFEDMSDVISTSNEISLPWIEADTSLYVRTNVSGTAPSGTIGIDILSHETEDALGNRNVGTYFDVYRDLLLKSIAVQAVVEGPRRIQIYNQQNQLVFESNIDLPEGLSVVELNAVLPAADQYLLRTDGEQNILNFGTIAPGLSKSLEDLDFPYSMFNLMSITHTDASDEGYYYFYNWDVEAFAKICYSGVTKVTLDLKHVSTEDHIADGLWHIHPNPVKDELNLETSINGAKTIRIFNTRGELLMTKKILGLDIILNTSNLPQGIYIIEIRQREQGGFRRFVKI